MARAIRKKSGTGIYHVMLRGINRQDIFEDEEDYMQMISILRGQSERYDEQGIQSLEKTRRNEVLSAVLALGAGIRQASRLTGVSFGVIQKTRTDPMIFLAVTTGWHATEPPSVTLPRACKATPSSSTTSPTILKRQNRQPSTSSSADTHRGQVWPLSWITDILYERSWGHHQRGATRYYVSSGIGIWGPKIRIGTRSEYLVLKITGNKQETVN